MHTGTILMGVTFILTIVGFVLLIAGLNGLSVIAFAVAFILSIVTSILRRRMTS